MKCVPRIPKLAEGKQLLTVLKTYYKKLWICREYCNRFGIKRFNQRPDLRYCAFHDFEEVTFNIKLPEGCTESNFSVKINIPKPIGINSNMSPAKSNSKGTSIDRANTLVMKSLDTSGSAFALQQIVELGDINSGKSKWEDYNETTLEASGLHVHLKSGNLKEGNNEDLRNNKKRKKMGKRSRTYYQRLYAKRSSPSYRVL